jgi:hypothetical protein
MKTLTPFVLLIALIARAFAFPITSSGLGRRALLQQPWKGPACTGTVCDLHRLSEAGPGRQLLEPTPKVRTQDCGCADEWEPVCGSDGRVYGNSCEAGCFGGVGVVRDVPKGVSGKVFCSQLQAGTVVLESLDPAPVIAPESAGKLAARDLLLPSEAGPGRKLLQPTPKVPTGGCVCTAVSEPVCGSDGRVYGNSCKARCWGGVDVVQHVPKGVSGEEFCSRLQAGRVVLKAGPAPVKGPSANNTNAGQASLHGGSQSTEADPGLQQGTRKARTQGCGCVAEWRPVCGSDGLVYGNSCTARCAGVGVVRGMLQKSSPGSSCGQPQKVVQESGPRPVHMG